MTFDQWVSGRRFRSPLTGNRILYKSLPKEEQEKIRRLWWRDRQKEETVSRGRSSFDMGGWQGGGWKARAHKLSLPSLDAVPDEALKSDEAWHTWAARNRDKVKGILSDVQRLKEAYMKPFSHMQTLYHGTDDKSARDIKDKGFRLTEGRRSGFLGAQRKVRNQAIFLSSDKGLARAFGENRTDKGYPEVVEAKGDLGPTLDFNNWSKVPKEIRDFARSLILKESGREGRKPQQGDLFGLLDSPEMVNLIKSYGYDAVRFREDRGTLKELGVKGKPDTIAVLDPSRLHIPKFPLKTLKDLRSFARERREFTKDDAPLQFQKLVKGKGFRNPDTGKKVSFEDLPSREQARIFALWRSRHKDKEKPLKVRGLIKVDKKTAKEFADKVADEVKRWRVRNPDERIGDHFYPSLGNADRRVPIEDIEVTDVRGRKHYVPVSLDLGFFTSEHHKNNLEEMSGNKYFTGGALYQKHRDERDPGFPINLVLRLNPDVSYRELAENSDRVAKDAYGLLIHEMTHAQDVLETPRQLKRIRKKKEPLAVKYYNRPTEVRAFKQQVADFFEKELEKKGLPDGGARGILDMLEGSPTWRRVRPFLSKENKQNFLRTMASIYQKHKKRAKS